MIYFYNSSIKNELTYPVTVCANSEKQAFAMCLINFTKHKMKGSPVRI